MEYLRAEDGQLYFLEMNTRLQVEHPVTEQISGLDLAQWQFRIAAGQGLPLKQSEVRWYGHAVEVRINAEDPENDFRPAPGTLERFEVSGDGIRVDTHLAPGAKIPPHYDSLIAKVIATGETREQAIERMQSALEQSGTRSADYLRKAIKWEARAAELATDAQRYRILRNCNMDVRNRLEHYGGDALDERLDALNSLALGPNAKLNGGP